MAMMPSSNHVKHISIPRPNTVAKGLESSSVDVLPILLLILIASFLKKKTAYNFRDEHTRKRNSEGWAVSQRRTRFRKRNYFIISVINVL